MLNYDSASLKGQQKRTDGKEKFSIGITAWLSVYWLVVIIILGTVLGIAYSEVGKVKGVI